MWKHDGGIDTTIVDHAKCLEIIFKTVPNYDGVSMDEPIQRRSDGLEREKGAFMGLLCDPREASIVVTEECKDKRFAHHAEY